MGGYKSENRAYPYSMSVTAIGLISIGVNSSRLFIDWFSNILKKKINGLDAWGEHNGLLRANLLVPSLPRKCPRYNGSLYRRCMTKVWSRDVLKKYWPYKSATIKLWSKCIRVTAVTVVTAEDYQQVYHTVTIKPLSQ